MKDVRKIIIFITISILSFFQIVFIYSQYISQLSFFPDWKTKIDRQTIIISDTQGVFLKIVPANYQYEYKIIRNDNILTLSQFIDNIADGSNNIQQTITLCKNCYLIDEKMKKVLTQKNINDDIVLKKKVMSKGYTIQSTNSLDIKVNSSSAGIFDPINNKKILIDIDQPSTIYLDEKNQQLHIQTGVIKNDNNSYVINQKFNFL